jgi:hypothetical protein
MLLQNCRRKVNQFTPVGSKAGYKTRANFFSFPGGRKITEAEMKVVLAAMLFVTVVIAAAKEAAIQSIDPSSEGRMIVAQRFCPNGRC